MLKVGNIYETVGAFREDLVAYYEADPDNLTRKSSVHGNVSSEWFRDSSNSILPWAGDYDFNSYIYPIKIVALPSKEVKPSWYSPRQGLSVTAAFELRKQESKKSLVEIFIKQHREIHSVEDAYTSINALSNHDFLHELEDAFEKYLQIKLDK